MPKHPEVTGILGVEDAFPVAQSRNHRAATFLAEHVTVGEPELAARLLDNLRELTRDRAEKAVTGIDGSAYLVGGLGMTALTMNNIVVVPIRTGVGIRLGANVGYLKFTPTATWNPF